LVSFCSTRRKKRQRLSKDLLTCAVSASTHYTANSSIKVSDSCHSSLLPTEAEEQLITLSATFDLPSGEKEALQVFCDAGAQMNINDTALAARLSLPTFHSTNHVALSPFLENRWATLWNFTRPFVLKG
jgi:hypothetical protein